MDVAIRRYIDILIIIITYHYWQRILFFDKLVCRIIKERLSACHMATVTEIILISEFHALH